MMNVSFFYIYFSVSKLNFSIHLNVLSDMNACELNEDTIFSYETIVFFCSFV